MPIFVGYGFAMQDGRVVEFGVPPDPRIRACRGSGSRTLPAFSTSISSAGVTPLFFRGDRARPALGLAVAAAVKSRSPAAAARPADVPLDLPEDGAGAFRQADRRAAGGVGSRNCRPGSAIRTSCAGAS